MTVEKISEDFKYTVSYTTKNVDKLNSGIKLTDMFDNTININSITELTSFIDLLQKVRLNTR